jgi:hypothetical protein
MGPIHLGSRMGTDHGIYPGRTGDGKFDGETFEGKGAGAPFLGGWGRLRPWGGGGGEEELQGTTVEAFSQDDASSKHPCFMLYIIC